ncbi:MAG: Peroxiredoxin [Neobacillus sp.]|nr:Peroxiredoxin [Neobacillus sp.]
MHPLPLIASYQKYNFPQILDSSDIKWNFTKFLIDQNGNVVKRYFPSTLPEEMENDIEKLLK